MPFHVVIDVRRWGDFGIGTYIRNLVGALARIDHDNRYTLIARTQDSADLSVLPSNFQTAGHPRADTDVLHNVSFPYFLRRFRADLYHIPLNSVAYWMPRPYVVTIHDMSSLLFPSRRLSCCSPHVAAFHDPACRPGHRWCPAHWPRHLHQRER